MGKLICEVSSAALDIGLGGAMLIISSFGSASAQMPKTA